MIDELVFEDVAWSNARESDLGSINIAAQWSSFYLLDLEDTPFRLTFHL